jgi:processing peptidase subunit alpha
MMRRHTLSATAAGTRAVANFNFGHPDMTTEFLPQSHYKTKSEVPATPVRVSKLPNGVRVVSHDRHGPQVSVGAYIEAGAKFDPLSTPGLNYVLRWALSGSNMENSLYQLDRNARSVGAAREHVEVRKRFVGIKFESPAGAHWERLAWDIFSTIAVPRFPEVDVERFRDTMDNLREELRWQQPREYAVNQLETVAFFREPLGNPRYVAPEFNGAATHAALLQQWATFAHPSRVVIAGVNVEHDALVAAYENAPFNHRAEAPHHAKSPGPPPQIGSERNQYVAGNELAEQESRPKAMGTKPDMEEETIVALGFLAEGAEANPKGHAAALVTREILAIALGEGLAVNRDAPHFGVESFYRGFSDAGLFGATIRSAPGDAKGLLADTAKQIRGLAAVEEGVLKAAKARAAARYFTENLEVNRDYLDFLATNLIGNKDSLQRLTLEELQANIEAVDAKAVKTAVEGFKATRPTLFSTGDVLSLPSLRQLGL